MEKKVKVRLKKLFAIFTLIILLQNYGLILGNIAIATENELFDFISSGNSDFLEIMKEKEEQAQENSEDSPEENVQEPENTDTEEQADEEQINNNPEETLENTAEQMQEQTPEEQPKEEQPQEQQPEQPAEEQVTLPEQVISSSILSENASIYKGYFYANTVSGKKYETNYNYTEKIEVQNAEFVDEIYVEEEGDKFVFDTGVELNIGNNTYYKQTIIPQEEWSQVLGEEGYIEIYTKDGELVGTINKNTEVIDGFYVFNFDVDINEITIKIVNPVQNGTLSIKHIKAIKSELEYSRKQIELFRNIKTAVRVKAIYRQENVWELDTINNLINLEETESRMDLDLNTNEFSTMLENQITFNVTLKTNEERYDLFQNPTIEILMPSAIENVEITSVNLLYKNDLSLSSWDVVENDAGKKVIRVSLEGTQTEYTPGSMQEGTTLVIYTKINVDKLTSNTDEKIKMTYTNKNSSKLYYEVNGKEAEEVDIKFVSKEGILKANSILNYNSTLEGIYGFNDEVLVGSLDVGGSKKVATVNMAVVNNYSKELNNVSILGRIPSKDLVDGNGNDLGTTVDAVLLNPLAYSGVSSKIYYSYKTDAGVDDESWTETIADYGLVKSYKIVLDTKMKQGDRVEFSYNISIPENLNYNETMFNTYQVNYYIDNQLITEVSTIGAETEKREIVLEDCNEQIEQEVTTENKTENITVGVKVTKGGEEVKEGEEIFERQILRYTVVLKNTTSKTLNNVKLKGKANNSNLYYLQVNETENYGNMIQYKIPVEDDGTKEFEEITVEELKPNETLKLEYQVIVHEVEETEEQYVWGEIYLITDGLEETKIETSKNKIKQAKIELKVELGATETMDDTDLYSNFSIKYCVKIKNISKVYLENINLNILIPEELEYDPESYSFGNDELNRYVTEIGNGSRITFEIPKLEASEEKNIYIITNIKPMDLNIMSKKLTVVSNVTIGEDNYISNDYTKTAHQSQTDIEIEYSSNLQNGSEVKHEDEITYTLKLKNIGALSTLLNIWDNFPNGLDVYEICLVKNNEKRNIEEILDYLTLDEDLKPSEEIELIIKAKVDEEDYQYNQEYIENSIKITGSSIEEKETNVISFKINNPNEEEEQEENKSDSDEDLYTEEELKRFEEIENEIQEDNEEVEEEPKENEQTENNEEERDELNNREEDSSNSNIENGANEDKDNKENNYSNESNNNKTNNTSQNSNYSIGQNDTIINSKKGKYSIEGKAWLDKNKNGKYDSEETKLNNIPIRLYKSENGTSVVYSQSNLVAKMQTNSEGVYKFENLEEGFYLVMFEYDSEIYNLAEYKSGYAGETTNSDFIIKTTTIEGNKKTVAISDILQINKSNIGSIDLGLVQKDDCDIEIKKSISTITVEDDKGKEKIAYNAEEIAKLEIASKKLNKTKITIIYEFEIRNNGDLDTYVTNIADYLPEGLEFNEKNNSGWYKSTDNNLSNLSLVNTKIEPGKSKKLKLALTKQLTEDSLGSYINKAEVLETTNDKKLQDSNLDNNKSEIELLITIKTGKAIIYMSIITFILGIGTTFIILVKKKKINLKSVYK